MKILNGRSNDAVKASFWFLISSVIQKGITALYTPLFTRMMSSDAYGTYTIYQSWYSIVLIFATLNLSAGVLNNALTNDYDRAGEIGASFVGLSTLAAFLCAIIFVIIRPFTINFIRLKPYYLMIMIVEALFASAYSIWAAMQRYDYKYKGIVACSIITAFVWPVIALISVHRAEDKAFALIMSYASIQVIIGAFFYVTLLVKGKKFFSNKYWKFALSFNIPLIPHYLSYMLLNQSDRIMIDYLVNSSSAAFYGVAYSVSMVIMLVVSAVNSTLTPFVYKTIKSGEYDKLISVVKIIVIMSMVGCTGAMLLGPEIMRVIAAPEYYQAVRVIPPITASVYFIFCQGLVSIIEFYYEKTKYVMVSTLASALLNIALNYLFIPQYGYVAAGYTTLVSYIFLFIIHYLFSRITTKKNLSRTTIFPDRTIFICSGITCIGILPCILLYDKPLLRWVVILTILVIVISKKNSILAIFKSIKNEGE